MFRFFSGVGAYAHEATMLLLEVGADMNDKVWGLEKGEK